MSRHLREEDICRWMAGERNVEAEQHLAGCRDCGSHVARMSEVLGQFRDSAHTLAGAGTPAVLTSSRFAWGRMAAAVLVAWSLAVAASLSWHRTAPTPDTDDAALLRRVDAEVSRTVPSPMEPLAALMPQGDRSQEER
jgi:hypothetical protein